ncbi:Eukaryotic translation initiation factor 2-alpha kinase 3 [Eumeta japonica]|uniref:non-specific serine/threonine protein kinase n=1 Tax=Eumeta variegata TaxID=151549 RepID=A0A4C1XT47_EUMVA|nr:Eukaryotic translation initiation factor 2-alpha kinase 3 [Eumeta japonica]
MQSKINKIEHHLALSGTDCIGRPPPPTLAPDYTIAVAVPEGVVGVKTAGEPPVVVWQHKYISELLTHLIVMFTFKLEAPVASIWRLRGGTLQNIDVLWAATKSLTADAFVQITPPSLYIGLHEHQLYVQEGLLYTQKMSTAVASKPLPWKIKQSRPLLTGPETALSNLQDSDPNTLALITLYGNAGQGSNHGYFLYNDDTCDQSVQIAEEEPDILNLGSENQSEHHHIHVHVYSLWFWWKEVLLIAISSALLMNLMIWPRFFAPRLQPPSPLPMNQECIVVEKHYDRTPSNSSQSYVGRYETDFSPVRCLGRGGFGVVFEAKNNIDHCSYAVKRITLPRRESKRERVLREVRALAKLEHENIVRYFNAWLEEPPPMWQEERDAQWIRELDGVSVQMTEDYTSPKDNIESPSPLSPSSKSHSDSKNVVLNMNKCQWEKSIDTAMNGLDADKNEGTKRNRSLSCNDSLSITFEEPVKSYKKAIENSSDVTIDGTLPKNFSPSKHLGGGDNDDSFIVFAQPEDVNHNSKGLSVAIDNISKHGYDRTNDSVRTSQTKSEKKRKKGHARHWSLDMCVKSTEDRASNGGTKMYLYIQMQLCRRDSLHDWLRINRTFEARADLANSLFSQIVSAVEYVHLAGLIHRDLKPSNIFFAPDGKVKVGDFGLVTAMGDNTPEATPEAMDVQARHTYRVGTHLYMSPEQMEGRTYSYKVDIYSLGLILFELLYPFGTESERIDCLLQLRRGHYPKMFQNKHPNEMEVLKLMLSEEPTERPTASGVRARAPLYQCTDERYHFCLPQAI